MTAHTITTRLRDHRLTEKLLDPLLRNGVLLAVNTAVSGLLGFAGWIIAARAVPAGEVGITSGLVAAMTMATLIANLGLGTALVQVLPGRTTNREWMHTTTTACVLAGASGFVFGALTLVVVAVAVPELGAPGWAVMGPALVLGTAAWTLGFVIDFVFVAAREAALVLARNTVFALVKLALFAGLARSGRATALSLFGAWVLSTVVSLVVAALVLVPRLGRGRPGLGSFRLEARGLLRPALSHLGVNLGGQVPGYVVPLLVVAIVSAEANAYYSAAFMSFTFLSALSPAVASSLFAEGSHGRSLSSSARMAGAFLLAVLVPLVLLQVVAREPVLSLFGPDYAEEAGSLLALLALGCIPDAVSNIVIATMRVQRRFRAAIALNLVIGTTMIVGTAVLLPVLGLIGAGWAWLAAQTTGAIIALADVALRRRAGLVEPVRAVA